MRHKQNTLRLFLAALGLIHPAGAAPVDFAREVRPIFQQKCESCHGAAKQKSGLRLDRKEDALRGGDNISPLIKPGDANGSALLKIVSGQQPNLIMPPNGDKLTPAQVEILRRWIDEGAKWQDAETNPAKNHWAFQPLKRPVVPQIKNSKTAPRNALDNFLIAKLQERGLQFSPEADKPTIIRRLYFSLIGLPPSPEEIESFVADKDPQAYEKLVDKLLASPRYGEKWARHWLDVVRFAESNGFEMNRARDKAWPYRDYVIEAFNDDKPYDRFLIEQIAGDQLGADAATGFLVGGSWDQVKSPDPVLTAQQRSDELHDMVSTTGSAFLGLTVGCARCHAHKFDPISQTDYFRFVADFSGVQHGERPMHPADFEARLQKIAALKTVSAALDKQLEKFRPMARLGQRLLLDDKSPLTAQIEAPVNASVEYSPGTERGQMNDAGDAARLPNLGLHYRYWEAKAGESRDFFRWNPQGEGFFRIWLSWGVWTTHAKDARYILDLDGDLNTTQDQSEIATINQSQFADGTPAIANQKRWSDFKLGGIYSLQPSSCIVLRGGTLGGPTVADALLLEEVHAATSTPTLPHLRASVSPSANTETFAPIEAKFVRFTISKTNSAEPCLDELEVFAGERNVAAKNSGALATASGTLPGYAIHKLEHINDGSFGNAHSWISDQAGSGWVQIEFAQIESINRIVWSRDRQAPDKQQDKQFDDRLAIGYVIEASRDGKTWQKVASSADRLPDSFRPRITEIRTLENLSDNQQKAAAQLVTRHAELQKTMADLGAWPDVYAGQFSPPPATYRLSRGDPMQPKEVVAPGALSSFGAPLELPDATPEAARRMALAKWIADPQHPLTARVLVNRLWLYNFGNGIVDTPSDFGLNGAAPSHPQLLDWLASEFISQKWSIKQMQRLIVNSAAFRQSSAPSKDGLAADAGAKLLWRFPPRRLEAEALRDSVLQISGKLDLKMGGAGFDLFEPNDNYVKIYKSKQTFGEDTFRRMVYQTKPRMQLDDTFGIFDCPDAGQIAPKRNVSTTPLQALALLNNPFLLQQSEFLAGRIEREAGADKSAQTRRAFQLVFGRAPSPDETKAAQKLIEQNGLVALCRALFNANEFLYVF